jgi:hypothetical protein
MSVEEHGNAVRPPLTRGESLPAVSLAQPFVVSTERTFKQEKHPIRTASFDTATAFKPNGEPTSENFSFIAEPFLGNTAPQSLRSVTLSFRTAICSSTKTRPVI